METSGYNATVVRTPADLLAAVDRGDEHIELQEHLDVTTTTPHRNLQVPTFLGELLASVKSIRGNCTTPPPEVLSGPPLKPLQTRQCVIVTDMRFLRTTLGATLWLDGLYFRYVRRERVAEYSSGLVWVHTARVWMTSVTMQGNGDGVADCTGCAMGVDDQTRGDRTTSYTSGLYALGCVFADMDGEAVVLTGLGARSSFVGCQFTGHHLSDAVLRAESHGAPSAVVSISGCTFTDNMAPDLLRQFWWEEGEETPVFFSDALMNVFYDGDDETGAPDSEGQSASIHMLPANNTLLGPEDPDFVSIWQSVPIIQRANLWETPAATRVGNNTRTPRKAAANGSGGLSSTEVVVVSVVAVTVAIIVAVVVATYCVLRRRRRSTTKVQKGSAGRTLSQSDPPSVIYDRESDLPPSLVIGTSTAPSTSSIPHPTFGDRSTDTSMAPETGSGTPMAPGRFVDVPEAAPPSTMSPNDSAWRPLTPPRDTDSRVTSITSTFDVQQIPRATWDSLVSLSGTNSITLPKPSKQGDFLDKDLLEKTLDKLSATKQRFLGQFELLGPLHRRTGGQGLVQFATSAHSRDAVAIKFFLNRSAFDCEEQLYLRAEVREMMPAITLIENNDSGVALTQEGWRFPPFIVVEKGESLDEWQNRIQPDFITIMQVLSHVVHKVSTLHRLGVSHRDLKPGNVLWRPLNHSWTLIDFGCAAEIGEQARLTFSPAYSPPETLKALRGGAASLIAEEAADMWAVGVIAYELVTRAPAFPVMVWSREQIISAALGETAYPWEHEVGCFRDIPELRILACSVKACLDRDPKNRPSADWMLTKFHGLFDTSKAVA